MITYLKKLPDPTPQFEVGNAVEVTDNSGLLMLLKSGVMEPALLSACAANGYAKTRLTLAATGCKLPRAIFSLNNEPNQYIVVDAEGRVYFTNHIKLWRY